MATLVPLTTFKGFIGMDLGDTSQDFTLQLVLEAASEHIQSQLGRRLEKSRVTEYYTGNGTKSFVLRRRPVWTIHSLRLDFSGYFNIPADAFSDSTTLLTEGVDFVLEQDVKTDASSYRSLSGVVHRIRTIWDELQFVNIPGRLYDGVSPPLGNIEVDYTAGYDPIPYDIQAATCIVASQIKSTLPSGYVLESERIGDYSYTILTGRQMQGTHPVFGSVDRILARYREVPF